MEKSLELLIQHGCPGTDCVIEETIDSHGCSFKRLREKLVAIGTILEEDAEKSVFLVDVRCLFNHAIVSVQLKNGKIHMTAYAKEGILKQNTAHKATARIKATFLCNDEKKRNQKRWVMRKILLFSACLIAFVLVVLVICSFAACSAIHKYNTAANDFNALVDEYNQAVSLASVDNIVGIPTSVTKIQIEDTSIFEGLSVVVGPNSIAKIGADTQTIRELIVQLQNAVKIVGQITVPEGSWVESRLKGVEGVTGVEFVTEQNNPDGLLNKEGGYVACLYFTYDKIGAESIPGDSIVSKGADAGGAIEIYGSLVDAEARCEYLAGYDGTILYSGSYAIIGTMVVRTSYILTNEEQFNLTNAITQALTRE